MTATRMAVSRTMSIIFLNELGWESVKCFISALGRLDLLHILALHKLKYCCILNKRANITMFRVFQFPML